MDGSINGSDRSAGGATATDQRALVLIDALGARLVEAIKAGVNATADGLGVLAGETERLDQRIVALSDLLERQAPVEATVDLAPVLEMLAELRAVVTQNGRHPDAVTRDHLEAEGNALAVRLDALETSVRTELADLAEHVTAVVGGLDVSPTVDPLDAAVAASVERVEQHLHELRSIVDTADRTGDSDVAATVTTALADLRSLVDERFADLRAALPVPVKPDLAPVVDAVGARLAEVRGSLQARIDEIHAAVVAGPDLTAVTDEVASAVAALNERLDRIESALAAGPDLSPIVEQVAASVAEARDVIAAQVNDATTAVTVGIELAGVHHDAVVGRLTNLESELQTLTNSDDVVEAVASIRAGVDVLADRLDAARGASSDEARSVQEAVLHAVEALAADVAAVRERAMATAENSARTGQELQDALAALAVDTSARVDGLRDVFSHGTDLTPFLDAVSGIERQVADVRATVEHHAPGAGILELLRSLGELREAVSANHDHVAAEVTSARSNVERWMAQLDVTISEIAGTQAEDMGGLIELTEHVRQLATVATERTGEAADRLARVEAELAAAEERHGDDVSRWSAIQDTTAATAERTAALAGWAEAQQFEQWVGELRRSVDEKLVEVGRTLPAVREAVDEVQATVRRAGDATTASLDGLRAHLSSAGGFTGQVERFRELKVAVDAVAAELARANRTDISPTIAAAIDDAAARAVTRLEGATASAMAQYATRGEEVIRHTADVESNLARSIAAIEGEVREVVSGLAANERLVRSRFAEVETALHSLRGEVAHVRTLRSTVDALISSLDVLRHQTRVAAAVPAAKPVAEAAPAGAGAAAE